MISWACVGWLKRQRRKLQEQKYSFFSFPSDSQMYIIWASVIPVVKIERFLGLSKLYHNRDMFPITYKKI